MHAYCRHCVPTEEIARLPTFTVPAALRKIVRANQRVSYQALFAAGSATIRQLAANPRCVGTDQLGFFGALHTWGRDFTVYHPHVHFVVPGGGISPDGSQWLAAPENFLFPAKAASLVYRAKFRDAMRAAGLYNQIDPQVWQQAWVVDLQPVGDGRAALKYLAPYVYRVAISDNRIVAMDGTSVTYKFTPTGKQQARTRTVSGQEFVRGFLQHTLPRRLQKLRYYGFASPNARHKWDEVRWLVWMYLGWCFLLARQVPAALPCKPPVRCADCGEELQLIAITSASGAVLYHRGRLKPYQLDSS